MGHLWFGLFFFILAGIAFAVAVFILPERITSSGVSNSRGFPVRFTSYIVVGLLVFFGVLIAQGGFHTTVSTRSVGVVTQFGRPVGIRTAGIAWHWPWQKISELTESIQLQTFDSVSYDDSAKGNAVKGADGPAVQVRLGNGSNAYVNENLSWRLREGAAMRAFQDYGGSATDVFGKLKEQLVDRHAQVALAKVFSQFNPQASIDGGNPNDPNQPVKMVQPDYAKFAEQVKRDLQEAVGDEIEIIDVRIPAMFFDSKTQDRIDQFNQKVQETRNAQQDIATNDAKRAAAQKLNDRPKPDVIVAIVDCINQAAQDHRDASGCFGQIGGTPLIQLPQVGR